MSSPLAYFPLWSDRSRHLNLALNIRAHVQNKCILTSFIIHANMSRCVSVPAGLCFSGYSVCLLPPTMHIAVMPIGKGAISCNTCLETVLSFSTQGTCNALPQKKKKKIKNEQWTSAVMEEKIIYTFLFLIFFYERRHQFDSSDLGFTDN